MVECLSEIWNRAGDEFGLHGMFLFGVQGKAESLEGPHGFHDCIPCVLVHSRTPGK